MKKDNAKKESMKLLSMTQSEISADAGKVSKTPYRKDWRKKESVLDN